MLAFARAILLMLALGALPAVAEDLGDFVAAVDRAEAQYHIVLGTLETAAREQTAAEVRAFRETWQDLIDRLAGNHPAVFKGDAFYGTAFIDIDTRLVAALIVIDIGSRDAARDALAPIGETLAKLRERAERR